MLLFDIISHFEKLEEHKGSVLTCDGQKVSITVEEGAPTSSGMRTILPTKKDWFYGIKLRGKVLQGEKMFIYCESALDNKRLISREYCLDKMDREYFLFFRANYTLTYFGVLTTSNQSYYQVHIDKCQIETLDEFNIGVPLTDEVESKPLIDFFTPVPEEEEPKKDKTLSDLMTLDWSQNVVEDEEEDDLDRLIPPANYNIRDDESDEESDRTLSPEPIRETYLDRVIANKVMTLDENRSLDDLDIEDILKRYSTN